MEPRWSYVSHSPPLLVRGWRGLTGWSSANGCKILVLIHYVIRLGSGKGHFSASYYLIYFGGGILFHVTAAYISPHGGKSGPWGRLRTLSDQSGSFIYQIHTIHKHLALWSPELIRHFFLSVLGVSFILSTRFIHSIQEADVHRIWFSWLNFLETFAFPRSR